MLDSSPIRGPVGLPATAQLPPPPPKKLKRSASAASLPSPPPSVQPPRKRAGRIGLKPRNGSYAGDSDTEQNENDEGGHVDVIPEGDEEGNKTAIVGRMILFPTAASLKLPNGNDFEELEAMEDDDDPFVVRDSSPSPVHTTKPSFAAGSRSGLSPDSRLGRSLSPVRRSPRLQAAVNIAPVPSTPVKTKKAGRSLSFPSQTRQSTRGSAQKIKHDDKGKCKPHELPVIDDTEDNPFFVKSSPRSKKSLKNREKVVNDAKTDEKGSIENLRKEEKPTVTYVFKGVKTHLPNPYYNLSPSAYERSQLPLEHPDYELLPAGPSQLKFKPKKRLNATSKEDRGEGSSNRPIMSEEEEEEENDGDEENGYDIDGSSSHESSPRPAEPHTPESKPRVKYSGFKSESGKPLLDSGPEGVRGAVLDPDEIGRMAVGPARDGRGRRPNWQRQESGGSDI